MIGVVCELLLIIKSQIGAIIHLDSANVEVGRKASGEKWCYRSTTCAAAKGPVLLLEDL